MLREAEHSASTVNKMQILKATTGTVRILNLRWHCIYFFLYKNSSFYFLKIAISSAFSELVIQKKLTCGLLYYFMSPKTNAWLWGK
jgi:hypothetical protein